MLFLNRKNTCLPTQKGTPIKCHTRKSTVLFVGIDTCEITVWRFSQFAQESYL